MSAAQPLPAFEDNYIWRLADAQGRWLVVDPGDAAPVLALQADRPPEAILLTHHHSDHIGGVTELLAHWPDVPVYAPADPRIGKASHRVAGGQSFRVADWTIQVIDVAGHTTSHIAFLAQGFLFCGDALFSLGCGRMFEGTPAQMLAGLDRLAALPADTQVCCGHEYTLANAAFALAVEPDNPDLQRRYQEAKAMRHQQQPTLPSTLGNELACNPFLRTARRSVQSAVASRLADRDTDRVAVFAALRSWKDGFTA